MSSFFPRAAPAAGKARSPTPCRPATRCSPPRFGQFCHLWIDLSRRHGLEVIVQEAEWGTGADPERIEETLKADKNHEIKGVIVAHNETATGVTCDIAAVRRAIDAARHPALLYVDGVCSIGSIDFRMDEWGVDLVIIGLAEGPHAARGSRLMARARRRSPPMKDARAAAPISNCRQMRPNATGYFPYTPSLPLLHGLREALAMLREEGLDNVFARHRRLADGARAAVEAWGLKLCAKEPKWHSDTVTAIMVPAGFNGADVIDRAYRRYNLALGAGLSQVAGKLFRIGHLGDLNELMLLGAIAGAEMAMRDVGIEVELGSGVAAAQAAFRDAAAATETRIAAE